MSTVRWRLDVAYDGSGFHGWAAQPGLRTVQGVLEDHIQRVLSLPEPPSLVVAGRTDAGVHARGQVCHLDVPDELYPADLQRRLGRVLPPDVVCRRVSEAPPGFDARFGAVWRRYCYRLVDAGTPPDPLLRSHVVPVRHAVDVDVLHQAADLLLGLRDFAAFCKPREGATTIRDLRECHATRRSDGVVEIQLLADAFCHSMVRSVVGALVTVGGGRRDVEWLAGVLSSSARHPEVTVMPAAGLTLEEVAYPEPEHLAARAAAARAVRTLPEET